jgi:hypothetical protein
MAGASHMSDHHPRAIDASDTLYHPGRPLALEVTSKPSTSRKNPMLRSRSETANLAWLFATTLMPVYLITEEVRSLFFD